MAALLSVTGAAILQVRLFDLQISQHENEAESGRTPSIRNITWQAARGVILDRNQRMMVWNTENDSVVAHPAKVEKPEETARALGSHLNLPTDTLLRRIQSDRDEMALKRHISPETAAEIRSLNLPGIEIKPEPARKYLKGTVAGQVIGFVDIDVHGQGGIEKSEDSQLAGKTFEVHARPYGDRKAILNSDFMREVPLRGADVVLTLDETIQWISERALNSMCQEQNAKSGMAVVMDPANGEVLALANYPSFDPEKVGEYAESGEMERAKIHCIANLYEPGSTIKPFVVAAGLESGVITLDTKIDCQDGLRFLPKYRSIPIKDEHQMGEVPVTEVLVFSSNIGIGKIAERIVETPSGEQDRKKFYDYLTLFGFGAKTGIELPGETQMILRPWSQWNLNDMLVVAFGTGPVMASPLGLAGAYCILANGGWQVSPHVIRGYLSSRNGSFYPSTKGRGKRVISAATAKDVQNMLLQVVERGTGTQARSGWYETGGKTGTAKKVVDGVYSDDHRVLSFAGFAPKNPPRIVVVVMIDEPEELRFGGQAAAPVFRQIVEETLAYLHVPPDMIPSSGPKKKDKAPGRHEQHKPVPASPGSRPPFATTWAQPEESHRVNHRLAAADLLDPSQKDKAGWSAREPQTEMARRAGQ